MRSLEKNIQNALQGFAANIVYTNRPKEKASLTKIGLFANSFAFSQGTIVQDNQKYIRYMVNISLYQNKVSKIRDCKGDEDLYFERIIKRLQEMEAILLDVFSLIMSANNIQAFNDQIQLAYSQQGVTDQSLIDEHKILDHSCEAGNRRKFFCYSGPCTSSFVRIGADLNSLSEAEKVDFVTIQFEIWKPVAGLSCCDINGEYVAINNPIQ